MNKKRRIILVLMLVVPACAPVGTPIVPASTTLADACPSETADLNLLMNAEDGYCLLYPADYSVDLPHFIIINPVSGPGDVLGDAWVSIDMDAAAGRKADQVADAEIEAVGPDFNIIKSDYSAYPVQERTEKWCA